jgi:MFS family permease
VEPYARGRFDVAGLITGGAGVAMVLYALSVAAEHPWTSPGVAYWGVAGLALLLVFGLIELRAKPPILDLRLFKQRLFALGNATNGLSFASFSGLFLILTLFIQELQGKSPLVTGFIQAPSAVASAIALALAGRLYGRVGPRRMMLFGYSMGILTVVPLLFVDKSTAPWLFALLLVSRGLVTPFAMIAAQTIVYGPLDNSKQGPASSIYNTNRQVAASFGVALMATVEVSRFRTHLASAAASSHAAQTTQAMVDHAQVMGYHDAFVVSAVLMVLAAIVALFVNDRTARAAMRRRVEVVLESEPPSQPAPTAGD